MIHPRVAYASLLIVRHDLEASQADLKPPIESIDFFRRLRHATIALKNARDLLQQTARFTKDAPQITAKRRAVVPDLDAVNDVRNKVGGHLEHATIMAAIVEEPMIFAEGASRDQQMVLSLVRIWDAAFNTRLPRIFDTDIDFVYPPNADTVMNWLLGLLESTSDVVEALLDHLDQQIDRIPESKMMETYMKVGLGEFEWE